MKNLTTSKTDHIISTCREHLEQTGSDGTEIEYYLTGFLLIGICSEFEKEIRRAMMKRICSCNDPHIINYIDKKFQPFRHLRLDDIRGEILAKFDDNLKTKFNQKIEGKPAINYDNIVTNRHNSAHGESINLTFNDLVDAYDEARKVIAAFEEVIVEDTCGKMQDHPS